MPGRSSFSKSSFKSSSKSTPVTTSQSTPSSAPVQHHSVKVEQPGFFSNMMQGFALGTGQSFAFNLFRSNPTPAPATTPTPTTSFVSTNSSIESSLPKEFVQCMKESNNDKEACKHYLD
jgi:hypothetical protein